MWVKVVSVLGGTSYKRDVSPLFLTRWQHDEAVVPGPVITVHFAAHTFINGIKIIKQHIDLY